MQFVPAREFAWVGCELKHKDAVRRYSCMTQLTLQLASTHDHWFDEPATDHALVAARLRWRQFVKRHLAAVDALEWVSCCILGIAMLVATLIANA
jgi:hypothetical protein